MKLGLTVCGNRLSPYFQGVDLWIVNSEEGVSSRQVICTEQWLTFKWKDELMRRDVGVLVCSGIDHFMSGVLQGCGIEVISDMTGDPAAILKACMLGRSSMMKMKLPGAQRGRGRRRRRRGMVN